MEKFLKPFIIFVLVLTVILCAASCEKDEGAEKGTDFAANVTIEDNTSGSGESGENTSGGNGLSVSEDTDKGFGAIHTVK